METNQKILYENFKKEAVEHKVSVIRERCRKAAEEILKSFPHFEKPIKETPGKLVKEKKIDSKEIKEKK